MPAISIVNKCKNSLVSQFKRWSFFAVCCSVSSVALSAPLKSHVNSLPELEYGVVLYDYFQENYFKALVEYEYAFEQQNKLAVEPSGQVLQGGIMLSYGMPNASQRLFNVLLDKTTTQDVSNRAWYYLSKIYYNKSERENAQESLNKIKDDIPDNIFFDYYYLSTLLGHKQAIDFLSQSDKNALSDYLPGYPYLLFNIGIGHLREGDIPSAIEYLDKVSRYSDYSDELSVLGDRAKNGLAQLALESGRLPDAWSHLSAIRTTGLYSNRALLSYAWSAIQDKQYGQAIPALKILNDRSIAIPEVQETKVLLAFLYEQQGLSNKALQSHITAEKQFEVGMAKVEEARGIIKRLDVPREFVSNLEAIMRKSDWYASTPSIDYQKLTPFLIDLMASNAFTEVLKELADLYVIRDNLNYWLRRSEEHAVILENSAKRNLNQELSNFFDRSDVLKNQLSEKRAELKLYTLSLAEKDQDRMVALLDTTQKELKTLDSRISQLKGLKSAYKQPEHFGGMVDDHHRRLEEQLVKTERHIGALEPVMRKLINTELDKHDQRMHYYWAQSRLAKARLYDEQLLSLERAPAVSKLSTDTEKKENNE